MKRIFPRGNPNLHPIINLLLLASILLTGGIGLARTLISTRQLPQPFDFAIYYLAASLLNNGQADIYHVAAIHQVAAQRGVAHYATQYPYPPVFAALVRPLALLPFEAASRLWLACNLFVTLLAGFWLWQIAGQLFAPPPPGVLALAFVLLPSLHLAWQLGQVSPLLLCLSALSLHLALRKRGLTDAIGSGMAIGAAAMVKVFPGILLAYALVSRKWRVSLAGLASLVLLGLVGVWLGGGWANSVNYVTVFLANFYLERMASVAPSVQSLAALSNHFFTPVTVYPEVLQVGNRIGVQLLPLINQPALAAPMNYLASLLVVALSGWAIYRIVRQPPDPQRWAIGFGMVTLLPLLIISTAYYHYSVLALLPMLVLVQVSRRQNRPMLIHLCLLAYLCLVLQRYANWLIVLGQSFWLAFFGLYGILLLWGSSIYLLMTWKESAVQP